MRSGYDKREVLKAFHRAGLSQVSFASEWQRESGGGPVSARRVLAGRLGLRHRSLEITVLGTESGLLL
jgi:hypothetical protein